MGHRNNSAIGAGRGRKGRGRLAKPLTGPPRVLDKSGRSRHRSEEIFLQKNTTGALCADSKNHAENLQTASEKE